MNRVIKSITRFGVLFEEPVSINWASTSRINSIPHLSEDEAESLLTYRQRHGPVSDIYELTVAIDRVPEGVQELHAIADYNASRIPELKRAIQTEHLSTTEMEMVRDKASRIDDIDDLLRVIGYVEPEVKSIMNLGFTFDSSSEPPFKVKVTPGSNVDLSAVFRNAERDFIEMDGVEVKSIEDPSGVEKLDSTIKMTRFDEGVYATSFMVPANADSGKWSYTVEGQDRYNNIIEKEMTFEVKHEPSVSGVLKNDVCNVVGKIPGFEPDEYNDDLLTAKFIRKRGRFAPFTDREITAPVSDEGKFEIQLIQGADVRMELPQDTNDYHVSIPYKPAAEFSELVDHDGN